MRSTTKRRAALAAAVSMALGVYALPAIGAEAIEEVIVTGSHIKGTPEDAALPVDVIDRSELDARGNPNALDLVRSMPYVGPSMGETNQFGPNQGTIGVGNVNLRGLGGMRTLVLMNGRRTTYTPAEGPTGVDTNLLPMAAMGRVEVLKDGAAATYGSDAIAGVVNFITRKDLEGLELRGEFRGIEDSDGDMSGSASWGWVGDHSNILFSYAQQKRSELKSTDRNWTLPPYFVNPTGYSAAGTPGIFVPRAAAPMGTPAATGAALAGATVDSNCTNLGGYVDTTPVGTALVPNACRFSYIPFDNLVEETEQQQLYGELNTEIADGIDLHLEGLWAETILPNYRTSPGYPPTSGPFGPGGGQFVVDSDPLCGANQFCNNPGALAALQQSSLSQAVQDATGRIQLAGWRPYGWGGVPDITGGNGGQLMRNSYDMQRLSTGLTGTFDSGWVDGVGWDVAVTYSSSQFERDGVDNVITRLQDALNGRGGPNCDPAVPFGQPGSQCQFFNPFSNGIDRNPAYGLTNPGFIPGNENSTELKEWMNETWRVTLEQSLFVVDAVLNGEMTSFELPGGNVGWAFGYQHRKIDYEGSVDNPLTDANITPCPVVGQTDCIVKTGPYIFLGQFISQDLDQSVSSVFAELAIPILDNLEAQFAIRYEDYGGLTGDTTDPKLSLRWQATDMLAFRGSVGSTFRGPTPVNLALHATGLQPLAATGFQYRSIDVAGNPDLKPEKADTFSAGVIFDWENFQAIVDYWSYEFEDQITNVPPNDIANAVGVLDPTLPVNGLQLANCNSPMRDFVIFDNNNTCIQGVTTGIQMQRVASPFVNASPVETTGFDVSLKYDFGDVVGGFLTTGVDATFVDKVDYDRFALGTTQVWPDYHAAGFANQERLPGLVSESRIIGHINYEYGPINTRYEVRFTEGVKDDRVNPFARDAAGTLHEITFGNDVDDYYLHNLYFNWQGPWETMVSVSLVNVLDEEPPEVRHQLSYDPYIGDPLGRTWEIGLTKTFGAP